jgi:hypothetical protein
MGDEKLPEEYLGDGAYVRFTGYSFIIYTSDGISETNRVHLEKNELDALDRFRKRMAEQHGELM